MNAPSKTPWIGRFLIWVLTAVFTILILWLLGFLVDDIKSTEGPDQQNIESQILRPELLQRELELRQKIEHLSQEISGRQEEQRIVQERISSLQRTINQLAELQRLSLQKGIPLRESQEKSSSESLAEFLGSQKVFQSLNTEIAELAEQKRDLTREQQQVGEQLEDQRLDAWHEYQNRLEKHHLKLAFMQLAVLLPLMLLAAYLLIRNRNKPYFPFYLAFAIAAILKVALVMHEYFPTQYFRYVLVAVMLVVVGYFLRHLIRNAANPPRTSLLKQYREAYERFLCPVCEYPIRTGPRRFLFWTRRTVNRQIPRQEGENDETPYSCPSCGTHLFESCTECGSVRHSLLPYCQHCGVEKAVTTNSD